MLEVAIMVVMVAARGRLFISPLCFCFCFSDLTLSISFNCRIRSAEVKVWSGLRESLMSVIVVSRLPAGHRRE